MFKNIKLDSNLIDDSQSESIADSLNFENNTTEDGQENISNEEEDQIADEVSEIYFKGNEIDSHEPLKSAENNWTHNQTTMFLNKYSENTNITSVANKMADIIVDYETNRNIPVENEDDLKLIMKSLQKKNF